MGNRSLFYWARNYTDLKRGDPYTELKRTVSINILDFVLFDAEKCPSYHSLFGIYDLETMQKLTADFEMHFLELPKLSSLKVSEMSDLEKWLAYFSQKTPLEKLEEIAMSNPMIQKAIDTEAIFTSDQRMRRHYEKVEKAR